MDDEAECGCEGAVELDLGLVFLSADSVQISVNVGFHGVDINEVLHGFVVRVTEHFWGQRLVQVFVQGSQLEKLFPVASVLCFDKLEVGMALPFFALCPNVVNLTLNEFVSNFFHSWKVRILLLIHHKDHSSTGG